MKARLATAVMALALLALPSTAFAEDEPQPDPVKEEKKDAIRVQPIGAYLAGRWMDVPITRAAGGLGIVVSPRKQPIAIDTTVMYASGSTENGLDANRFEIGSAVTSRPGVFRVGLGGHLSYAWLTRKTMSGSIGGIGIGAHALLEVAAPIGDTLALTFGLRGSADLYDGGMGYEGGPYAGLRF